jgi:hypothetical protein
MAHFVFKNQERVELAALFDDDAMYNQVANVHRTWATIVQKQPAEIAAIYGVEEDKATKTKKAAVKLSVELEDILARLAAVTKEIKKLEEKSF